MVLSHAYIYCNNGLAKLVEIYTNNAFCPEKERFSVKINKSFKMLSNVNGRYCIHKYSDFTLDLIKSAKVDRLDLHSGNSNISVSGKKGNMSLCLNDIGILRADEFGYDVAKEMLDIDKAEKGDSILHLNLINSTVTVVKE
jgi:hypothetical protein